jgi:adenosylhomocysteine nucleosidase
LALELPEEWYDPMPPEMNALTATGISFCISTFPQNPSLRVGDVVVPERWALYQESHFARVLEDGTHRPAPWANPTLMGDNCGLGAEVGGSTSCEVGVNTWNFTFMYPIVTYGADPIADDPTIENAHPRKWYNVDPEMFEIAQEIAPNITLMRGTGNALLDYDPMFFAGGNGVSGSAFVDNAEYREYLFANFQATAVDMETSAVAHVAEQFGVKYIFFRSLSDLAGGEDGDNALQAFFGVAALNAVTALSAFMNVSLYAPTSPIAPYPSSYLTLIHSLTCYAGFTAR